MLSRWAVARLLTGIGVLAVVVWRLGAGPFLDGLRLVDAPALAAAAGIALLTTVCCAWRWSLVARGLGVGLSVPVAVAAYYRSQFLNTTVPGGVVGDVHRGVRHGSDTGDVGRGLRAVAWERTAGQVVQAVLTLAVLLVVPSPARASLPYVLAVVVAAVVGVVLLGRALPAVRPSRWSRAWRRLLDDLRTGLLARGAWPAIVLASALVVVGHVATFVIAARTAGSTAPTLRLVPLALLVLLAMSVPANVGGWGPREGVAAWVFAAAGLGAAQGVSTAVVYGVMVLVAALPGAAVLVWGWTRGAAARGHRHERRRAPVLVSASADGAPGG